MVRSHRGRGGVLGAQDHTLGALHVLQEVVPEALVHVRSGDQARDVRHDERVGCLAPVVVLLCAVCALFLRRKVRHRANSVISQGGAIFDPSFSSVKEFSRIGPRVETRNRAPHFLPRNPVFKTLGQIGCLRSHFRQDKDHFTAKKERFRFLGVSRNIQTF